MKYRPLGFGVGVTALSLVIAACSSGGSSGLAGPAASVGSGGGLSGGVAAAKAATAKNLKEPTAIPLAKPLDSQPPVGKTFIFLKCELEACQDIGDGVQAAALAAGWKYKQLNFKTADPATLVTAMKQALNYHPAAVGLSGLPRALWESEVAEYRKAGVPIVTNSIGPVQYDDTVIGQADSPADYAHSAEIIADWVVADSNGSANIVLQNVNDYPVLKVESDAFRAEVQKTCSTCKITDVNNTIAQIFGGQVVQTLVAAVQKDRSINYVVTGDGPFIVGLPAALAAAGVPAVKIAGENGSAANLAEVATGRESAFTGEALHYGGWLMIDIALRHALGMSFEADGDGGLPVQLLTKDVSLDIKTASYDKPDDYADQFKKLWLVG